MAVADVKTLNGAAAAAKPETQGRESQTPEPEAKKAAILAVIERASGVGPPPRDPTPSSSPVESID